VVNRVTAEEVREIISTEIDDDVLDSSFIDTAHLFVDTHLTACTTNTEAILTKIELYLAAHFVSISDGGGALKYTKLGDAAESFDTSQLGAGLSSSRYGQTAIILDTCGTLAGLAEPSKKAQFRVV